jgi:hypothetical protein
LEQEQRRRSARTVTVRATPRDPKSRPALLGAFVAEFVVLNERFNNVIRNN